MGLGRKLLNFGGGGTFRRGPGKFPIPPPRQKGGGPGGLSQRWRGGGGPGRAAGWGGGAVGVHPGAGVR